MSKSKKIIAVVCAFVIVVGTVMFAMVFAVNSEKTVTLLDCNGEVFAQVVEQGSSKVNKPIHNAYKEYTQYAFNEAVSLYAKEKSISEKSAEKILLRKNAVIKTAFDPEICKKILNAFEKSDLTEVYSKCCAVTDNRGSVVAVYGSGESDSIIYSTEKRYACSTIKPLSLYAPALNAGIIDWSKTYVDEPYKDIINESGEKEPWPANSWDDYSYNPVTVNEALVNSYNTVAVQVLKDLTVERSLDFLDKALGFDVTFEREKMESQGEDEILSNVALGYLYNGVSAVDLAGAYSVFANEGNYSKPHAVISVESDSGKELLSVEEPVSKPISKQTAFVMTKLLSEVVEIGTGKGARVNGVEVAGKTGTSTGNADNWFVGYTNEYSCAVWHNNGNNQQDFQGNKSAEIFADVIKEISTEKTNFDDSCEGVKDAVYCSRSGALKGEKCNSFGGGYFIERFEKPICNSCQ
ncbi:MAG: penicillin-binding transpeptidase domain-containing protein [Acutalibacteraceae bacterium]